MKPIDHPLRPRNWIFLTNRPSPIGTSDGELTKYFWTLSIDHLKLPPLTHGECTKLSHRDL